MFLVGILSWWYGSGLVRYVQSLLIKLKIMIDFFSIGSLFKTLFSTYRQISADRIDGPLGIRLRAFFDKLLSRFIGAMIRSGVILSGLFMIILRIFLDIILIILWVITPMLPVAGLIMWVIGWVPQ